MNRIDKFLSKLGQKRALHVLRIMDLIRSDTLQGLDIAPLKGKPRHFRCRTGNIRIIFARLADHTVILDADFRGSIYKK